MPAPNQALGFQRKHLSPLSSPVISSLTLFQVCISCHLGPPLQSCFIVLLKCSAARGMLNIDTGHTCQELLFLSAYPFTPTTLFLSVLQSFSQSSGEEDLERICPLIRLLENFIISSFKILPHSSFSSPPSLHSSHHFIPGILQFFPNRTSYFLFFPNIHSKYDITFYKSFIARLP